MMEIEPLSAALAAEHATPDDIDRLEANLELTRGAVRDIGELTRLDLEFHDLLAAAAGNTAVLLIRQPFGLLFHAAFRSVFASAAAAGPRLHAPHPPLPAGVKTPAP